MAQILNLRGIAENEKNVARFETNVVQQSADHAAAALYAKDDAAGLVTESDLLDGLADHARARRDHGFGKDELSAGFCRAAMRVGAFGKTLFQHAFKDTGAGLQRLGECLACGGDDNDIAGAERDVFEGGQDRVLAALDHAHRHVAKRWKQAGGGAHAEKRVAGGDFKLGNILLAAA